MIKDYHEHYRKSYKSQYADRDEEYGDQLSNLFFRAENWRVIGNGRVWIRYHSVGVDTSSS